MSAIESLTQALLTSARSHLAPLEDAGFEETRAIVLRSRFHLWYASAAAAVELTVDPGRSAWELYLRPPDAPAGDHVPLTAFLQMGGEYDLPMRLDTSSPEAAAAQIKQVIQALLQACGPELAGDWTRYTAARSDARRHRREALDRAVGTAPPQAVRDVLERTRKAREPRPDPEK